MEQKYKIYKSGEIRGDKIQYKEGVGCCIWQRFPNTDADDKDAEDAGLCWDFKGDELKDVLSVLNQLDTAEPDVYKPDETYEKWQEQRKIDEAKWYNKVHAFVEDVGITFTPFDWGWRRYMVSRPVGLSKDNSSLAYKMTKGFMIGPVTILW
jgi:hypothetical protein